MLDQLLFLSNQNIYTVNESLMVIKHFFKARKVVYA